PPARPADARSRRLQAGQRHLRPSARRRGPALDRRSDPSDPARLGRGRPLWRRRVRDPAARRRCRGSRSNGGAPRRGLRELDLLARRPAPGADRRLGRRCDVPGGRPDGRRADRRRRCRALPDEARAPRGGAPHGLTRPATAPRRDDRDENGRDESTAPADGSTRAWPPEVPRDRLAGERTGPACSSPNVTRPTDRGAAGAEDPRIHRSWLVFAGAFFALGLLSVIRLFANGFHPLDAAMTLLLVIVG